jgi:hypothetical protein
MRVAIHQPNYAPWCGYFTKLASVDVFIILDNVQLPLGRSYVSRTQVQGFASPRWLSVPVQRRRGQTIIDVRFADPRWSRQHVATLRHLYAKAPHFDEVWTVLEPIYLNPGEHLGTFNLSLIETVLRFLGIQREMVRASELDIASCCGEERLIALVQAVGGSTYLSGPGGTLYQDPARFGAAGLTLQVKTYEPIPYSRKAEAFVPGLSILDALFYCGRSTRDLLVYR